MFSIASEIRTDLLLGGALVAVGILVVSFLVRWIWNITMPDVFRLPVIRYWQAVRLVLLASFLFGIFRI